MRRWLSDRPGSSRASVLAWFVVAAALVFVSTFWVSSGHGYDEGYVAGYHDGVAAGALSFRSLPSDSCPASAVRDWDMLRELHNGEDTNAGGGAR